MGLFLFGISTPSFAYVVVKEYALGNKKAHSLSHISFEVSPNTYAEYEIESTPRVTNTRHTFLFSSALRIGDFQMKLE